MEKSLSHLHEFNILGFRSIELEGIRADHLEGVHAMRMQVRKEADKLGLKIPVFCVVLPGKAQNIRIQNITAKNAGKTGCSVTGIAGFPVKNVSLHNISMELPGGVVNFDEKWKVPELENQYPESTMFGLLPVWHIPVSMLQTQIKSTFR